MVRYEIMPELPEVETVLNTLKKNIQGKQIKDVKVLWDNIIVNDTNEFIERLKGQHFNNFKRRGKYLIFEMDDVAFVSHLRMEGKYYLQQHDEPLSKHIHVIFDLGDIELRYHDTRKFGKMELVPLQDKYEHLHDLGVEPFSDEFNFDYCKQFLSKNNRPIKETLLNQHFIAGIGNIYADEILFRIKVLPMRISNELTDQNIHDLIEATNYILHAAILDGGTTIRSYTSSLKVTGRFQQHLMVHNRKDEECYICHNKIIKTTVSKRGTYYCAKCQK